MNMLSDAMFKLVPGRGRFGTPRSRLGHWLPGRCGGVWDRRRIAGTLLAVALGALLASGTSVAAQPMDERTPNLEGTWVTPAHDLFFQISHRFQIAGEDSDISDLFGDGKVVNYPTFALNYGLTSWGMLGVRYSSNSLIAGQANEWQPYLKLVPLRAPNGLWSVSLLGAWNGANESFDGELAAQLAVDRLTLIGALRGFSSPLDRTSELDEAEFAVAGGAFLRLNKYLTLAGDYANMVTQDDAQIAWSAGLSMRIPYTPHTFGLFATNVTSGTLEGISVGVDGTTFWGFEFTIRLSGHRWGELFDPSEEGPSGAAGAGAGGPTRVDPTARMVEIDIAQMSFAEREVTVEPGTTVRWVNRDPVVHTVTSDEELWASPPVEPGASYEFTFGEPGRYGYHCIPHPFMKGTIVVEAAGGSG